MMFVVIVSFISFFLESLFSIMFNFNLLFSVVTLVVLYPFFSNKNYQYYSYAFFYGFLYDLVYTDSLFFNAFIFLLVGLLIKKINLSVSNNHISIILIGLVTIVYYRFLSFLALVLVGYLPFNLSVLLKSIGCSILVNSIYIFILYSILDYLSYKYRILKID